MERTPGLTGAHVRLEPLEHRHIDGLAAASAGDAELYQWSPVPQGREQATAYVETALAWRDAGTAVPFAIVRTVDGAVIGSTRFFNLERWAWPEGHERHRRQMFPPFAKNAEDGAPERYGQRSSDPLLAKEARSGAPQILSEAPQILPDACEIGYSWLARSAIRTAANTEAKLLMLTRAFEDWQALRVCFHTDARNERSRAALERIGAKFEGVLRSHRMAADFIARDSWRYSIVAAEWPEVKLKLSGMLAR